MGKFKTLTVKQQKTTIFASLLAMLGWVFVGSYLVGRYSCPYSNDFAVSMVIICALPIFFGVVSFFTAYFSRISKKDREWLKGGEI